MWRSRPAVSIQFRHPASHHLILLENERPASRAESEAFREGPCPHGPSGWWARRAREI